jgi:D-sedoheptulose 7-phosphate isomerase
MEPIGTYLLEAQRVISEMPEQPIAATVSLLYETWRHRKQLFIFGNGGSASTASHMANDLSKATIVAGKPRMRVMALTDNIALITAWANDNSYDDVFKEQLENLLESGDLVIAISASGDSPNILRAIEFAKLRGAVTVGWTGLSGGRLKETARYCVHAPTDDVGLIESAHLVLDHLVTKQIRQRIQADGIIGTGGERRNGRNGARRHSIALSVAAGRRI